jgi:hypothetical protein
MPIPRGWFKGLRGAPSQPAAQADRKTTGSDNGPPPKPEVPGEPPEVSGGPPEVSGGAEVPGKRRSGGGKGSRWHEEPAPPGWATRCSLHAPPASTPATPCRHDLYTTGKRACHSQFGTFRKVVWRALPRASPGEDARRAPPGSVARGDPRVEISFLPPPLCSLPEAQLTTSAPSSPAEVSKRRVRALVGLRLLEVMRDLDVPTELL